MAGLYKKLTLFSTSQIDNIIRQKFLIRLLTSKNNKQHYNFFIMTDQGSGSKDKRVLVLTADKFEDMEVYVPIFRLMEAGVKVDVAVPKKEEIHGE